MRSSYNARFKLSAATVLMLVTSLNLNVHGMMNACLSMKNLFVGLQCLRCILYNFKKNLYMLCICSRSERASFVAWLIHLLEIEHLYEYCTPLFVCYICVLRRQMILYKYA